MAIVEFDIPDVVPTAVLESITEGALQVILGNIAAAAHNHWVGLAKRFLHTSRADYVRSIQDVQLMPGVAVISLVGQPANLIENGAKLVDLRDWLLGANVPEVPVGQRGKHRTADGEHLYRAVPFRHQVPGTTGTHAPAMGDPYKGVVAYASDMGRDVYKKAQKLAPTTMAATGTRVAKWGERLPAGMAPALRRHHKTDIYAGMVRMRSAYKEKVQTQYMTFRTISTAETNGWIRPPTVGREFAKRTSDFVAKMAPMAFEEYVQSLGEE